MIQYSNLNKLGIVQLLEQKYERSGFESQKKFAVSIGLTAADISNLFGGSWKKNPQLIGDRKWIKVAQAVGYKINDADVWRVARTAVYTFVHEQLSALQGLSMCSILVDAPGIGKTFSAKAYARQNPNVFYLNGSTCPGKREFMRTFARVVGVANTGALKEQFEEALYVLSQMETPLIIIDEAGDLDNSCVLLIKRIYNELEGICGMYLIGSDGLKKKIERGIEGKVQGYTEVFSRLGKKFSKILNYVDIKDKVKVMAEMAREVCKANDIAGEEEIRGVLSAMSEKSEGGDLRVVYREVRKIKILKLRAA